MKNNTHVRRLVAALAILSSVSAFAGAQVVPTYATTKVHPQGPIPAETPASLLAARNEFVSFQVVVKADDKGAANVRASFPGLDGPSQIGGSNIQLYREEYLNLTQMSFTSAQPGRYPDALIPDVDETVGEKRNAFPFTIPANESRVIWVDVLVPQSAKPGVYTGTLTVSGDGVDQKVPVSISVVNAELPSTSSVASAFLFQQNNACATHTGNSECGSEDGMYALANKYQKLAIEHRITLSNAYINPKGDWATFDQRYGPWLDGKMNTRLPGARVTSVQYPGVRDAASLRDFEQHFSAHDWLSRAYDYTGDEPPFGISFAEAKARADVVKANAPGLRTLLTTTVQESDNNGLSSSLDLIVPVVNYMDGTESPYVGDQRSAYDHYLADPTKGLWVYQSCMSHGCAFGTTAPGNAAGSGWPSYMVDASAARNRAMQWVVFLERASGELYYETALALDTAWDSVYRFAGNGDGTLFYPGLTSRIGGSTNVPLPSLRLKQIRQGMQDYEWLKLLSDTGDDQYARTVAKELIPSAHQVSDDGMAFELARRKVIARWVQLQPQGSNNPAVALDPNNPNSLINPGSAAGALNGGGCSAGGPGLLGLVGLALALLRRR